MIRNAVDKVMWMGRATIFLVGLAVILALVFGLASAALAGMGVGAPFHLGKTNTVNRVSTLVNNGTTPALDLRVGPTGAAPDNNTVAPMRVNSQRVVANLNADELDGLDSTELAPPRGYAHVTDEGTLDTTYPSKGVGRVQAVTGPGSNPSNAQNMYCFDLTFTPAGAVGSPYLTNGAVVSTVTPPNSALDTCPAGYRDAAAATYGSSSPDSSNDVPVNFTIVFM